MQSFETKRKRHEFLIDGRTYWLPGLSLAHFDAAQKIDELEPEDRPKAFGLFLAERVRPAVASWWFGAYRGRQAASKLNYMQLLSLWQGWVGLPGEASSSSPVSPEGTGASSSTTSETSTPAPSTT